MFKRRLHILALIRGTVRFRVCVRVCVRLYLSVGLVDVQIVEQHWYQFGTWCSCVILYIMFIAFFARQGRIKAPRMVKSSSIHKPTTNSYHIKSQSHSCSRCACDVVH